MTPHDPRDTAASLAIDVGADANKVANKLGHTNAGFTLKAYAHLFNANINDVQDKMLESRLRARQERHERLQRVAARRARSRSRTTQTLIDDSWTTQMDN